MANINNSIEYVNTMACENPEGMIRDAEERYVRILDDVFDSIIKGDKKLVMLAGPSSSGKTTTANRLDATLEKRGMKAFVISLDDFYLNAGDGPRREDGSLDFETVHALDLPLIHICLKQLMENNEADIPVFDFLSGKRSDKSNHISLNRHDVVIIEGLHALNPLISDTLPPEKLMKLYVSVSSRIYNDKMDIVLNKRNLRFIRRLIRDYKFRASSPENTFALWDGVLEGEDRYLTPYKKYADHCINSIHVYEPCVFKSEATALLERVEEESPYRKQALRLMRSLEEFECLPAHLVPDNSLLREFLG